MFVIAKSHEAAFKTVKLLGEPNQILTFDVSIVRRYYDQIFWI